MVANTFSFPEASEELSSIIGKSSSASQANKAKDAIIKLDLIKFLNIYDSLFKLK